ncbi:TrmB family transcriptional regulator [Candidatus Woesearchaeota archaeon]|nr:TrmB family transcriptional regulator [Candidatus Woesearchaeota archaeon]
MSEPREIISNLLELGLNRYEAKVYLSLLEEGTSTAKNISDITGIPYGKVYEILTSLGSKGFSLTLPTKPMKCKATSPTEVLVGIRKQHIDRFDSLKQVFDKELMPLYTQSKQFNEPKGIFWVINGRSNIHRRMEELIRKAENNICISTSENGLKRLGFLKNVLKDSHDKGVTIKIISKTTNENKEDCDLLSFCDICNANMPITNNFISADSNESIIVEPIPDDDDLMKGRDIGILVMNRSFTGFLENLLRAQLSKDNLKNPACRCDHSTKK